MDGLTLKLARVRLGLRQTELASLLGVTQNTISRWESGKAGIRHPRILQLALERLGHPAAPRDLVQERSGDDGDS